MQLSLLVIRLLSFCPLPSSSYSLQGKKALVTGSSGGIGAGIAKALAREGADVLVHYNTRTGAKAL